ncbi:hypothetical protein [Wolbachia endosymbiont (group A) of Pogonocherus hispidulus]|uniref:hypothetical protein n=1 Tax=Wolbachia endosymbiont (group A) of Pogonocherus hispidulus TaxID=3066136 RepID=UPI00334141E5
MWKNIKKFFKWIADHTGISWVARKISSGWKWLFGGKASTAQQNTPQQGESPEGEERDQSKTTTPKTLDDEVNPDQSIPPAAPDEPQGPVINTSETDAKELPENFPTPNPKNADSDVLKEASNENYLKVGGKGLLLVLTSDQLCFLKFFEFSFITTFVCNFVFYSSKKCIFDNKNPNLIIEKFCIKQQLLLRSYG